MRQAIIWTNGSYFTVAYVPLGLSELISMRYYSINLNLISLAWDINNQIFFLIYILYTVYLKLQFYLPGANELTACDVCFREITAVVPGWIQFDDCWLPLFMPHDYETCSSGIGVTKQFLCNH